jgi:glycosyltransferase involved in cell wall biosynthesis
LNTNVMGPSKADKSVLVICSYPADVAPGQRFRFEQYVELLAERGVHLKVEPFWDASTFAILYGPGARLRKFLGLLRGLIRRALVLPAALGADYVFIYREATPLGPPWFETLLFAFRRRVIFDFDDAIFVPVKSTAGGRLVSALKCVGKVAYITTHSHRVSVSTNYLRIWALRFNRNVTIIPTTIGSRYFKQAKNHEPGTLPVIGWIGSHTTAAYLEILRPVLVALQKSYAFEFRVICNTDPGFPEIGRYRFIHWNTNTEVEEVLKFNIGLMPQPDDDFARGKAGLKAMQYSALGIVPVVSPTGGGDEVVRHRETGLVVQNRFDDWYQALESLLRAPETWTRLGAQARRFAFERFSVDANLANYLRLFDGMDESAVDESAVDDVPDHSDDDDDKSSARRMGDARGRM